MAGSFCQGAEFLLKLCGYSSFLKHSSFLQNEFSRVTGLITVVMGPVLLCRSVRHGLYDKSVFLWRVDQRIVSFLQIGHLKPAFFVHYLQKRHHRHHYRRWAKRVKKQKAGDIRDMPQKCVWGCLQIGGN